MEGWEMSVMQFLHTAIFYALGAVLEHSQNGDLPGIFDWLTLPVIICIAILGFVYEWPRSMGLRSGPDVAYRVQEVRASGALLGKQNCGALVGRVSMGIPVFEVEVYPGGLVIQYLNKAPVAIRAAELIQIITINRLTWQSRTQSEPQGIHWRGTKIFHRSPDIVSPILLHLYTESDVAVALSYFVPAPPQRAF
jgi:hypothetical protein